MSLKNGYCVFVEDDKDGWWKALDWQKEEFIKAMDFGTMKTMCYPNPVTKTEEFKKNGFTYRFIIINDSSPVFLQNMDTKKVREVIYVSLHKTDKTILPQGWNK